MSNCCSRKFPPDCGKYRRVTASNPSVEDLRILARQCRDECGLFGAIPSRKKDLCAYIERAVQTNQVSPQTAQVATEVLYIPAAPPVATPPLDDYAGPPVAPPIPRVPAPLSLPYYDATISRDDLLRKIILSLNQNGFCCQRIHPETMKELLPQVRRRDLIRTLREFVNQVTA